MLRWSFTDEQVLYLCKSPENVNQSQNMKDTCLLIDLLTKSIFSKVIFSINFKILFPENSGID